MKTQNNKKNEYIIKPRGIQKPTNYFALLFVFAILFGVYMSNISYYVSKYKVISTEDSIMIPYKDQFHYSCANHVNKPFNEYMIWVIIIFFAGSFSYKIVYEKGLRLWKK